MEDSRLKGYTKEVTHPILPLKRTYCANCGRPYGWVSVDSNNNFLTTTGESVSPAQIIVLCENCEETYGDPNLVKANLKEGTYILDCRKDFQHFSPFGPSPAYIVVSIADAGF